MPLVIGLIGFGGALLAYTVVLLLLITSHPASRSGYWLIGAVFASVAWSGVMLYGVLTAGPQLVWIPIADAFHLAAWVSFVATVLLGLKDSGSTKRVALCLFGCSGLCITILAVLAARPEGALAQSIGQLEFIVLLSLPLLGLLGLEQIARNSEFGPGSAARFLTIGVGLILLVDILAFSQVVVSAEVNPFIWQLRGIGNAIAAPFVLIAVKRQADWENSLFISRQVVVGTVSLTAAGLYLVVLGIAGALIRPYGGGWRSALELVVFLAACSVFVYVLFSTSVHRRFKVFIAKHFYKNRYDYRDEWLRFIRTLADTVERPLSERSVRALADIIGSPEGELWLLGKEGSSYEGYGAWNARVPTTVFSSEDVLVKFLEKTNWVIDSSEYESSPELYQNAFSTDKWSLAPDSIYVPLLQGRVLRGIVRLKRPAELGELSFEDHDLLKTAGQQVTIFLAQELAQLELAQTRQLEAFSKLTAFLMHDLKNLISQQELVVGNARRFKHRPDFIEDTILTIESSVARMKKVLDRLQLAEEFDNQRSRVELLSLVGKVVTACSDRRPVPALLSSLGEVWVELDREKLSSALTHAIRNAQDATATGGTITVSLQADERCISLEVVDTGEGMDATFIRDRLFKPFDSTKGAKGMGIGAYQIRETMRAIGGSVDVTSAVGKGTKLLMKLPLVRVAQPESRRHVSGGAAP
jgi:putative PEP-CTERM system histidine kinase